MIIRDVIRAMFRKFPYEGIKSTLLAFIVRCAALDEAQTFTAAQTFNAPIILGTNMYVQFPAGNRIYGCTGVPAFNAPDGSMALRSNPDDASTVLYVCKTNSWTALTPAPL